MEFTNALLIFYIIMIAGFFENFFSCDLQRLFSSSILAKHILAFISAFFLITLVEEKGVNSIWDMFKTTLYIYALYILSTKSKAMFVLPMLIILFVDQIIKIQLDIYDKETEDMTNQEKENSQGKDYDEIVKISTETNQQMEQINKKKDQLIKARLVLKYIIIAFIIFGSLHYYIRARLEFGDQFSHVKFFAGTNKCANLEE